jgi:hypothetical protein
MGSTVDSIKLKNTTRPPNLSVHMPKGNRIREPVSTGVAIKIPNCVSFRLNMALMGMPITANIIQIMKHTVKESVLIPTTDHALNCCVAICASCIFHCLISKRFANQLHNDSTRGFIGQIDLHQIGVNQK